MENYETLLRDAMAKVGLVCPDPFQITGSHVKFRNDGDKSKNSWYALHEDNGVVFGGFGCFKLGVTVPFTTIAQKRLSKEDYQRYKQKREEVNARMLAEMEQRHAEARAVVAEILRTAPKLANHEYLTKKRVPIFGDLRLNTSYTPKSAEPGETWVGRMIIPLQDASGTYHALQFIGKDKKFAPYGSQVKGCYFELASPEKFRGPIYVLEGYATGATVHQATGCAVICAMNSGNLLAVGEAIKKRYPDRIIIFAGDNDQIQSCHQCEQQFNVNDHAEICPHCNKPHKKQNTGLLKATEAAEKLGAQKIVPQFPAALMHSKPTDWNDLFILAEEQAPNSGLSEVRYQISKAMRFSSVSIGDLVGAPENDPSELLKFRYLTACSTLLWVGPAGIGKSTAIYQAILLWAICRPCFGITPTRPLRTLIIQAENDDTDMVFIRDGVCRGLELTTEQQSLCFERVFVHTSSGISGDKFCKEVLTELLSIREYDLVVIDPILAYLGGDAKEQKVVGPFLREYLDPVLKRFKVGAIIVHHTNKPNKKEESMAFGESAYLGSGSSEFANYPRAVLAIQPTKTHGVFTLHAGKRGGRLGWRDENDQPVYEKLIAHSRDSKTIYWREATDDELGDTSPGRKAEYVEDDLMDVLPDSGFSWAPWFEATHEATKKRSPKKKGMSESTFDRFRGLLIRKERVHYSKVFDIYQPNLKHPLNAGRKQHETPDLPNQPE